MQVHNIKPSIRLSLHSRDFDDDKLPPQKKIRPVQTDNFKVLQGKLVASEELSSGK